LLSSSLGARNKSIGILITLDIESDSDKLDIISDRIGANLSKLFESMKIRNLEIRNRIFLSPMCQYAVEAQDGVPTEWQLLHLSSRAVGGFGLIIAEASAVVPEGRISPRCTGIWNDEQAAAWARVNEAIHRYGAKSAIQLAHAGRKASAYWDFSGKSGTVPASEGGWQTVSATDEAFSDFAAPHQLTTEEVAALPATFRAAAHRSIGAGFDAIEIHAAHGYLIHQFLSPITNQRDDQYGGDLQGRAKLLIDIVREVRAEIGEGVPLFVRFSATDYREDGWTPEETAIVAGWCRDAGADLFDISSGGLVTGVKIPTGPGYQVPFAEQVADGLDAADQAAPVTAVGQITDAVQAETILRDSKIQAIMIGRAGLRDPYWPLRAAHELGVEIDYWAPNYGRGKWPVARA
jgi:2,4-dienoyl-CoA reductase-like NADH-dependent reductase (Old Yellow Enzyme family)